MCGIAGFAGSESSDKRADAVRAMLPALARRGPDAEGFYEWPQATLGHRRLAIFDLSPAGIQPMVTPDGTIGVVFNGAIYNFRSLRRQLEDEGFAFRSRSDTEVLLYGYRRWGIRGLLERLRGMFAFALWDEAERTLWLARDRLGVKPLLYVETPGGIAFASTARALRRAGLAPEVDPKAVLDYLQRGYVADERSIWSGVRKLPAAHLLEWRNSECRLFEYWEPPSGDDPVSISFEEAVEETERLLLQAVARRLEADVPVAALLSGGIDSGLVCWAVRRLGSGLTALTVSTGTDPSDETEDARATAFELGIRHKIIQMDGSVPPDLDVLVEAYSEPFGCASALGMLQVAEAGRREAVVLLTGDGGDDVFLGYPEHRACLLAENLARVLPEASQPLVRRAAAVLRRSAGPLRRAGTLLELAGRGLAGWQRLQDRLGFYRAAGLLGPRLAGLPSPDPPVEDSLASARRLVPGFLEYDRRLRFVGEYMTKVDGGAMHYAVEARSPFLDQDLWEFAASLPPRLRLRGGELKAILRALARRRISDRLARGRKRGFTIPVARWLAGPLRKQAEEAFDDSLAAREGWINARGVARLLAASRTEAPLELWFLLVFEKWLRYENQVLR